MFYLFHEANLKTSLNKGKPRHSSESRRNHIKMTRVFRKILRILVFIGGLKEWRNGGKTSLGVYVGCLSVKCFTNVLPDCFTIRAVKRDSGI